jgi:hypothetical protein
MANIARWVAGASPGLTWTAAFGAEINSMSAGNCVRSSVVISNGSSLDLYCDLSFGLSVTTAASGTLYATFILLPQNQDGATYGPGNLPTSSPGGALVSGLTSYQSYSAIVNNSQTVVQGTISRIVMPPGSFTFVFVNNTGATLGASANTVKYRTYSENLNG